VVHIQAAMGGTHTGDHAWYILAWSMTQTLKIILIDHLRLFGIDQKGHKKSRDRVFHYWSKLGFKYFDNVTLKNDKMSHSSNNNRIFDSSQEINSDTE